MRQVKIEKPGLLQAAIKMLLMSVVFGLAVALIDGIRLEGPLNAILAVIVLSILSWLLQPIFNLFVRIGGLAATLLVGLFANAILVYLAIELTPGIVTNGFLASLLAAWVFALLLVIIDWAFLSNSNDVLVREAIRHSQKRRGQESDDTGFVFVQLDGVSFEVLHMQLRAGNLPNIAHLLREKNYELEQWRVQLPSTTPASQAGILHGSAQDIPAFRWFDKQTGALVVANQVEGAHQIESNLSDGKGLLADGGVSLGNLFSGDAETSIMVMSKLGHEGRSLRELSKYSNYFTTSYGFMRSFILSVGEIFKEFYQASKQRRMNVQPRVHRSFSYAILRAATNVLMRDIQTTIVIDHMMRGVNSLYVDYLDYDEVAHHAGLARPEAIQSLIGLDGVVGALMKAKDAAPRPYELVFVSDHGQSQGPTFKQLHGGVNLAATITQLCNGTEATQTEVESAVTSKNATNAERAQEIVVTGSGNLGNVWFQSISERARLRDVNKQYPDLLASLTKTEGIGLLIVRETRDRHLALSADGEIILETQEVTGKNPLQRYDDLTAADLLELTTHSNAPDIAIISDINPQTGEVFAFEELVGNHGGAGGWQREAILLRNRSLQIPSNLLKHGKIRGAAAMHAVFVSWLEKAGQRKNIK